MPQRYILQEDLALIDLHTTTARRSIIVDFTNLGTNTRDDRPMLRPVVPLFSLHQLDDRRLRRRKPNSISGVMVIIIMPIGAHGFS